jgi:hypothetical protein
MESSMRFEHNGKVYRLQFRRRRQTERRKWSDVFKQHTGLAAYERGEVAQALHRVGVTPPVTQVTFTTLAVIDTKTNVVAHLAESRCSPLDQDTREAGRRAALDLLTNHMRDQDVAGKIRAAYFGRFRTPARKELKTI